MFKKIMAFSLLINIGLFHGAAFANNLPGIVDGPEDAPICTPGSIWDPYKEACVRR